MFFWSALSTNFGLLKTLFRLEAFLVKMWRAKARFTLIFPVPVFRNRFAAPRFVLILGTPSSFVSVPNRTVQQGGLL